MSLKRFIPTIKKSRGTSKHRWNAAYDSNTDLARRLGFDSTYDLAQRLGTTNTSQLIAEYAARRRTRR